MITNKQIADAIFPNINLTVEDLENKYPLRNLVGGAEVTRFAPSPTGFLHTGSLFTSMICRKVATQTNGVFFIRLEDTDMKREIAGSGERFLISFLMKAIWVTMKKVIMVPTFNLNALKYITQL